MNTFNTPDQNSKKPAQTNKSHGTDLYEKNVDAAILEPLPKPDCALLSEVIAKVSKTLNAIRKDTEEAGLGLSDMMTLAAQAQNYLEQILAQDQNQRVFIRFLDKHKLDALGAANKASLPVSLSAIAELLADISQRPLPYGFGEGAKNLSELTTSYLHRWSYAATRGYDDG